jgi:inosose dehydratase
LAQELESRGLRLASAFLFGDLAAPGAWPGFQKDVARLCDVLGDLGSDRLVLIPTLYTDLFSGKVVAPSTLDADSWQRLAETCNAIGEYSRRMGIRAVFHPHAESPIEYPEQAEELLQRTDPELIGLCLDTGHHAYRGGDAVAFARAHADRLEHIHLKNVDPVVVAEVSASEIPFAEAVRQGVYCELEYGVVDVAEFFATLHEIGYEGWAIVEQDMFPAPADKPLPIARRNREFLRRIGAG